ncbi:hypothetical protein [Ciceribacter sp. RN22]|uniref:hypothetical protein n=1 Tax=Ciceribacter sp. RN22 TaxID=2954932 RepID=UPI002093245E|nr:hypothetical protein [Ciceribacter sp. RN22]MCO6177331.1 hypothetical protein [Ciceribacter sp. RN22]
MSSKARKSVYFTIGRDAGNGVFTERTSAAGSTNKVMNSRVFNGAVLSANRKFKEVSGNFLKRNSDGKR